MKVYHKKIYLEHYKSRTPSLLNSFDTNGKIIDFTSDKSKILDEYPMGNYGMFPCDILLDEQTPIPDLYAKTFYIPYVESGFCDCSFEYYDSSQKQEEIPIKIIKYGVIKEMYFFFLKYLGLLKKSDTCDNAITSATQYWEFYDRRIETEEYYRNLDEQYEKYGGIETCNYVMNNVFKTFPIPSFLQEFWGTDKLFYIDVLFWHKWFESRNDLYSNIENCQTSDDCCDCTEYKNRGGYDMFILLDEFINNNSYEITFSPETSSIDLQIFINKTIDDMGEFSIFSSEWEGGVDYSSNDTNDSTYIDLCGCDNCDGFKPLVGTTVIYNDEVWVKTNNGKGFILSDCMKFTFNEDDWMKLSEVYDSDPLLNIDDKTVKKFTYDCDDILVILTDDVSADTINVAKKIDLVTTQNKWVLIDDVLYPIFSTEYIEMLKENGETEYIQVYNDFNRKYVTYKSKRYYSLDGKTVNPTKIPLLTNGQNIEIQESDEFIIYHDILHKVSNNDVIVDGYFYLNGKQYFVHDSKIINNVKKIRRVTNLEEVKNTTNGYYVNYDEQKVYMFKPYVVYDTETTSGVTTSKLDLFKNRNTSCDDAGNVLMGDFKILDKTYSQPLESEMLDLQYTVGNVNDVSKTCQKCGSSDIVLYDDVFVCDNCGETYETIDDGNFIFWGNILNEITFYYVNSFGDKTSERILVSKNKNDNLASIEKAKESWKAKHTSELEPYDNLVCEFEYYIGANLTRNDGAYKYKKDGSGVKYTDTCVLQERNCQYYLTRQKSYNVKYYELIHKVNKVKYGSETIELPISQFEYTKNSNEKIKKSLMLNPIFKEEYKIGISTKENIDDNIYIERQIIKPLERNLRLIDVMTLESLEKYGNGSPFNIINNS